MNHKGEYPKNWENIAKRVKEKADWCCENCGHPDDITTGHVLTVHHLDLDKSNCEYSNLVALCQKCHLSIQAKYIPGQLFLIDPPNWVISRGLS